MKALSVHKIFKSFGTTRAVNDLSFSVEAGEICAFIGPNGAGKTSTVRMILDLIPPDSGEIQVLEGPIDSARKDRIGYLPEERGLYRNAVLLECIRYFAHLKGLDRTTTNKRASEWLETFALAEHEHKTIGQLSRGMQQKAQFITALIHKPDLLIVDEPFAALDPVNTKIIKQTLRNSADEGAAVVLCTHQMHLVEELADNIIMIYQGELALGGRPEEIRRNHASGRALLSGQGLLHDIPDYLRVEPCSGRKGYKVTPIGNLTVRDILSIVLDKSDFVIEHFELERSSLEQIFIETVNSKTLRENSTS